MSALTSGIIVEEEQIMGFLNGLVKRKSHTRKVGTKTVKVRAATVGSIAARRHKKATTKRRK